ncbi:MAG: RNA-binding protein [Lachnospiraceae bacterium]
MDSTVFARMEDLAVRAQKRGMAYSKFLTAEEAAQVQRHFAGRRDIRMLLDGGFTDAERSVAVFVNPEWGSYDREEVLAAVLIEVRRQDTLTHRDVLGSVLGLGLERSILGDIYVGEQIYLICLADLAEYIIENLKKAGRIGLRAQRLSLSALPEITHALEESTDTVASLRLDAVSASMFRLSRGIAAEYIRQGKVQLAHMPCEDPAKMVQTDAIISIRGLGRGKILEIGGQSKKNRTWIRYGIY